jgi:hypothetical protein
MDRDKGMRSKIIRALSGLAILALIASLLLPVWSIDVSSTTLLGEYDDVNDYRSFGMKETITNIDDSVDTTTTSLMDLDSDLEGPLMAFLILTIVAIVLSFVAILNDYKFRSIKGGKIALALAALIALLSPVLFVVQWSDALQSGEISGSDLEFSGSDSGLGFVMDYGPGIGWYLQLVAFGLLAFALVLAMNSKKEKTGQP